MTILDRDAPVRGVFVLLDGVRNEYPRATGWAHDRGSLSIRRRWGRHCHEELALFGRFDHVGYMSELADGEEENTEGQEIGFNAMTAEDFEEKLRNMWAKTRSEVGSHD